MLYEAHHMLIVYELYNRGVVKYLKWCEFPLTVKDEVNNKYKTYYLDIYLPNYNLVIEIDGKKTHNGKRYRLKDPIRDELIYKQHKLKTIRVSTNEIIDNIIIKNKKPYNFAFDQSFIDKLPAKKLIKEKLHKEKLTVNKTNLEKYITNLITIIENYDKLLGDDYRYFVESVLEFDKYYNLS